MQLRYALIPVLKADFAQLSNIQKWLILARDTVQTYTFVQSY